MSDDLGRGMLGWTAERWQALDTLAADTVTEHVVLRNIVERQEAPNAYNVRIAGKNVAVEPIAVKFKISMQDDEDADIQRKVRINAEELAQKEDAQIVDKLSRTKLEKLKDITHKELIKAKNDLKSTGIGVVVSSDVLTELESGLVGAQSALDVAERVVGAKFLQSSALESKPGKTAVVVVHASPAAYRMVRAWGPRLRVLKVDSGNVELQIEEGIAVGELEGNRCVIIEKA